MTRSAATLLVASALLALASPAAAEPSEAPRLGLSWEGYTGLLVVPSAHLTDEGAAELLYTNRAVPGFEGGAAANTWVLSTGLFPYTELAGRITEVLPGGAASAQAFRLRDLSLNLKLQLPLHRAHRYLPAIALGTQDEGGAARHFRTRYVVATEELWRFRLSLGYGTGPQRLDGWFGGVEARLHDTTSLLLEHDGDDVRAGARVQIAGALFAVPFRVGVLAGTSLRKNPGVIDLGFSAAVPLDLGRRPLELPLTSPAPEEAPEQSLLALQAALVEEGFENVRFGTQGRALVVEYENEVYNRSEKDGLRVVRALLRRHAPEALAAGPIVRVLHNGVAVAEVRGEQVRLAPPPLEGVNYQAAAPANPSRFHARVTLAPGLRTFLATELGLLDYVLAIRPELTVPLWRGAAAHARWDVPVAWSKNLGEDGPLEPYRGGPQLDHALLYQGGRLLPGLLGQVGAGVFRRTTAGVLGELLWAPAGGTHQFGLQGAYTRTLQGEEHPSLVASYRGWLDPLDAYVLVRAGQFFEGDRGVSAEVGRYFGDTSLAVFAIHTDRTLIGAAISLPLTPRKDMKPGWVQVRGAPRWRYAQSTVVGEDRNPLIGGVGVVPATGYSLEDTWLDAGRLRE